jgi:hypothetical protein
VATSTDAARDRVLAAREHLDEELQLLEASGRAAVDIPARVRRSPAKAAAIAGSAAFLVAKGPQRLFRGVRRAVRGPDADLPRQMLPKEIEKTLRKLGDDGDRVRGTIERDFAEYVKGAQTQRKGIVALATAALARPLLTRGLKVAADAIGKSDPATFQARLTEVRARADQELARRRAAGEGSHPRPTEPPAGL